MTTTNGAGVSVVFLSTSCGHCRHVAQAVQNLHLDQRVRVVYVDRSAGDYDELVRRTGGRAVVPTLFDRRGAMVQGDSAVVAYLSDNRSTV